MNLTQLDKTRFDCYNAILTACKIAPQSLVHLDEMISFAQHQSIKKYCKFLVDNQYLEMTKVKVGKLRTLVCIYATLIESYSLEDFETRSMKISKSMSINGTSTVTALGIIKAAEKREAKALAQEIEDNKVSNSIKSPHGTIYKASQRAQAYRDQSAQLREQRKSPKNCVSGSGLSVAV